MFHFQNIYLFFITTLILNITPGNDVLYVSSRSISQGTKAGIISALGVFCGCFVHIMAAALGLSLIIARSAYLFSIIKFAGAAYLIFLGVKALVTKPDIKTTAPDLVKANKWKLFKQGFITDALNPKVAIFFLSFLPQFVDPASPLFKVQLVLLGLWFAVQGTIVLILFAIVLGKIKGFFKNNPKVWLVQEKITGIILIGLGIKVALSAKK
jgi:threonine/homoserine/homoserine lactone efflux protein